MALSLFLFGKAVTEPGPIRSVFNGRPFFQRVSNASCLAEADHWLQKSCFDVAVVDLDAEGGAEVLRQIREDSRHCHIPVIGLSGNCQGSGVERLLAAGLDSVVAKPVEPNVLQSELRYIIGPTSGRVHR